MSKKIGIAIVIAAMLWGISAYLIPTFFIKATLLNKIENKENLTIIPKGEFQDFKIDRSYIQSLRDYSLGHLFFSIPQEYKLYSSKDDAMVFKVDAKNVIMVMKSSVASLDNQFKRLSGRAPQIEIHDYYQFMKKALYSSSNKTIMTKVDAVSLVFKALLLGSKEHIMEIFEYETENLNGFMMVSQMNENKIKRFEMFGKKDDWISILFINSIQSQGEIDSILSTFNY